MHVVQLVPSLAIGGAEVVAVHLASWLHSKGISVEVVYFENPGTLADVLVQRGIPVGRVKLPRYVWRFYPWPLLRHLSGREDVVLHSHLYAWHKGTAVARRRRVACVYTQHGTAERWISRLWREMKRSAKDTDAAVAVSEDTLRFLLDRLRFPRARTHHIPNGVPDLGQATEATIDWGAPIAKGSPVVGMVSRLAKPKDPHTLVEAMIRVRATTPNAQLVFIGAGQDQDSLREHVQSRNAAGYVHLLGDRRDVASLLRHLDVFVLSSFSEGHSIAVLEAMAAARPIVTTRVGGNVQLLADGACGLLTPAGEAAPMAEAIQRFLGNPAEARRFGERARRRFLESYSLDRMGEAYLAVYHDALAGRPSS
jgi:glycosyltransferase involved in cell wall biosynthesis